MSEEGAEGTVECNVGPDGRLLVEVSGEFDISNADDLRVALEQAAGPPGVVLDAGALRFIDSSGIAVLLQCAARSGAIEVRNAPAVLRRIVEVSGLDGQLRIVP